MTTITGVAKSPSARPPRPGLHQSGTAQPARSSFWTPRNVDRNALATSDTSTARKA